MIPGSSSAKGLGVLRPAATPTHQVWFEDFLGSANGQPSSTNWSPDTGRWDVSGGEQEYYNAFGSHNVFLDGHSNLSIVTYNETTLDGQVPPSTTAYTSARITTRGKQTFSPPCKVAARMLVPYTKGLWPALWMEGDTTKASVGYTSWPAVGEIDIAEWVTDAYSFNGHLHMGQTGSLSTNISLQSYTVSPPASHTASWCVHGIDWYTDHIDWHLNGVVVGTITQTAATAANGDWTPLGSSGWPFYILINTAVGSTSWSAVGQPDATSVFPQTMLIDWVGVWSI